LRQGLGAQRVTQLQGDQVPVIMIDVMDDDTLLEAGRLAWELRGEGLFSASSSGLQYALTAYWRSRGWIPRKPFLSAAEPAGVIGCVSGSCSPVTASQIAWARVNGLHTERLNLSQALDDRAAGDEIDRVVQAAARAIRRGRSAIVYSAEGPDDPAVAGFDQIAAGHGLSRQEAAHAVGAALAEVMRRMLEEVNLKRIVVAGGDSSGEVASALDIDALTVAAELSPGAPLCRAWSRKTQRDGLEIVLKGGQMGGASFFGLVRDGHTHRSN
jgi:uncharacterized protein YgbK (DUF1537 family)